MSAHRPGVGGRRVVVIGGSGAVGQEVVRAALAQGADVLAVARQPLPLQRLASELPALQTLALDAARDDAAAAVFDRGLPQLLVVAAGVLPPAAPVHELDWAAFSANWESDVKIAFLFVKEALKRPLAPGACVVLVASGAALAGSPNSGGYAGAKRTQMFIANYAQKESDRRGLGLHFVALAPRMMPQSTLGRHAIQGYAHYLGISATDFVRSMDSPPAPRDVAAAVLEVAAEPARFKGRTLVVDATGMKAVD
jgi:NAD(P)-dependent dehydrogenase (short-subunit alcohol dehydrogenase family)